MSNFSVAENTLVGQNFDETSTTQEHRLGIIVRAKDTDPTL